MISAEVSCNQDLRVRLIYCIFYRIKAVALKAKIQLEFYQLHQILVFNLNVLLLILLSTLHIMNLIQCGSVEKKENKINII